MVPHSELVGKGAPRKRTLNRPVQSCQLMRSCVRVYARAHDRHSFVTQVLPLFWFQESMQLSDASEYANEPLFQWDHHERRSRRGASSPGGHAAAAGHAIEACSHDTACGSWCHSCAGPCSLQRCHWGRKHASTQTKAHSFKAAVAELAPSVVHSRETTDHLSYHVASGSGSGLSASPRSDDEGSNSSNASR